MVRLNWQIYIVGTAFSFKVFSPPLKLRIKQHFCNTSPFSERDENSSDLSTLPVPPVVSQLWYISPGIPGSYVFLQVLLTSCFKTIFDLETVSPAFSSVLLWHVKFFTPLKVRIKHLNQTSRYPIWEFFYTLSTTINSNHNINTNTRWCNKNDTWSKQWQ